MLSVCLVFLQILSLAIFSSLALASPFRGFTFRTRQASLDNTVDVSSVDKHCIVVPRDAHTNIGESEHPGGTQTFCTSAALTAPGVQGQLPLNFWRNVDFKAGTGKNGGRFAQLTGCINAGSLDRLNPGDAGGQYDSNGGPSQRGNPEGSVCLGFKTYIELLEPAGPRACIKCCDDPADCPLGMDTAGCPNVIPGNYFNCT